MTAVPTTAETYHQALLYVIAPGSPDLRDERIEDTLREFFVAERLSGRTYASHTKVAIRLAVTAFIAKGLRAAVGQWMVEQGVLDDCADRVPEGLQSQKSGHQHRYTRREDSQGRTVRRLQQVASAEGGEVPF